MPETGGSRNDPSAARAGRLVAEERRLLLASTQRPSRCCRELDGGLAGAIAVPWTALLDAEPARPPEGADCP